MTPYLVAFLALWVAQTILPGSLRYGMASEPVGDRLSMALRGRDVQPEMPVFGARAQRALVNLGESAPVFLTLGLLAEWQGPTDTAMLGAAWFLACRVAYVPAYISAVPGVRSAVWMASWLGLLAMGAAVLGVGG